MGLRIGVTGGIGSGKSMVCRIFKVLGVPTYDADREAKDIMSKNQMVRQKLVAVFGDETYLEDGSLNRQFLSEKVFQDEEKLNVLNGIVHPAVIQAGTDWANAQTTPYTVKEAALLFESGSYKQLDYTILVTAPEELRIKRVMNRDQVSRDQVIARMTKQMPESEKQKLADMFILNDNTQSLIQQVMKLHQRFSEI